MFSKTVGMLFYYTVSKVLVCASSPSSCMYTIVGAPDRNGVCVCVCVCVRARARAWRAWGATTSADQSISDSDAGSRCCSNCTAYTVSCATLQGAHPHTCACVSGGAVAGGTRTCVDVMHTIVATRDNATT